MAYPSPILKACPSNSQFGITLLYVSWSCQLTFNKRSTNKNSAGLCFFTVCPDLAFVYLFLTINIY
jgi:hypothetical protein